MKTWNQCCELAYEPGTSGRFLDQCLIRLGDIDDRRIEDALKSLKWDHLNKRRLFKHTYRYLKEAIISHTILTAELDRCQLVANDSENIEIEDVDKEKIRLAVSKELEVLLREV